MGGNSPLAYKLVLEDGSVFRGSSFGGSTTVTGEVVFNTGMTGYVESLSDPSYKGQILVLTYPLVGNYGVPEQLLRTGLPHPYESLGVQVLGLVVQHYEGDYSHHDAVMSLKDWLTPAGIPAISGIDTRALTKKLREHGTMRGKLCPEDEDDTLHADSLEMTRLVSLVSDPEVHLYENGTCRRRVLVVDCGAKHNILRSLLVRGVGIVRVPFDHDFSGEDFGAHGILISNGPGDPMDLSLTISHLRRAMEKHKPILGICLGHQLLALAAGGSTRKLRYGHRSQNQPVRDLFSGHGFITSQNHGYVVDETRIPDDFKPWFVNVNDGTNEGIRHSREPFMGVQFHPEAFPGPVDAGVLFDEFISLLP
jgi:carbamoyl-phosphate synthase small subunit